jgi:anti-anti-sigma factor
MAQPQLVCQQDTLQIPVLLQEHFDYRSIAQFRNLCPKPINEPVNIVLDMAATRYIDSSGMALIMCLFQWVRAPQVSVQLINCSPAVRRLIELSRCRNKVSIA